MTLLTKTDEEDLALTAVIGERIYHEAHRIAAHGGAEPIEIAGLSVAMAVIWAALSSRTTSVL